LIGSLIEELNSFYNLGLGTTTIHDRMVDGEHESPSRRYLFIGGSHAIKEGNAKRQRMGAPRPRWIDQPQDNVMVHGV
jgi:hypothetical protein